MSALGKVTMEHVAAGVAAVMNATTVGPVTFAAEVDESGRRVLVTATQGRLYRTFELEVSETVEHVIGG